MLNYILINYNCLEYILYTLYVFLNEDFIFLMYIFIYKTLVFISVNANQKNKYQKI